MDTGPNDAAGDAAAASHAKSAPERNVVVAGNRINSRELFADERELLITHGEDTYRLRLTFQNKLILTK
ncbi:MAG: hemin transporter HemP [Tardiphaga sp.]|jgi:hemin uptake protein HemP|uniref:hemin uptake protein HemP n=1 Tax=Tardiphaga sp. TaxID=1926292 RepID=UPI00261E2E33|nr:hemin uptake protein HemP [Tardiphaga sp.]MDB5500302.1 hemin transporter HemP [Tardiphaga sp.]